MPNANTSNDFSGFFTRSSLSTSSQNISFETIEAAINRILDVETYTTSSWKPLVRLEEFPIKEVREIELVLVKLD